MASLSSFLRSLGRLFSGTGTGPARKSPTTAPSAGQSGTNRTVQLDPREASKAKLRYSPHPDDRPDPGEVVWTWVPYEENDGRGKDRPMLIVARLTTTSCLGVALTSKSHDGDRGDLRLGSGAWDQGGRASWARIDRLFRVHDKGMRREGSALDARTYDLVAKALRARYRW